MTLEIFTLAQAKQSARGSNSAQLRHYNERIVLQILRRLGQASKADLARSAKLTNAAIGGIINSLTDRGLIEEAGKFHGGGRGQPATLLKLSPRGAFGFGVRVDRTSLETVLVDFDGKVIGRRTHDTILPNPEKTLTIIRADLDSLMDLLSPEERKCLTGIGLAQPFNLGSWLHELGLPEANFRLWDTFDMAEALRQTTNLAVFAENDGTSAAIAELFYGLGRQNGTFLYLFIGPAIGGGLCIAGDVVKGVTGNAGDVAMIPVPPSGLATAPKPKRQWDVLLTRASLVALDRHLDPKNFPSQSRLEMQTAAERNNPKVQEWQDDCISALTPAIGAAFALLDMPLVIIDSDLGGPVIERLITRLSQTVGDAAPEACGTPRIRLGSFGRDAGAIGAASLPMFFNFSPRTAILTGTGARSAPASADIIKTSHDTGENTVQGATLAASPLL